MFTRKDYMSKKVSHDDYYAQFVTTSVKNTVSHNIGPNRIINSKDKHFNDIPLIEWDRLQPNILPCVGRLLADANDSGGVSLSDCVCVAKAAARIIKEENNEIQ